MDLLVFEILASKTNQRMAEDLYLFTIQMHAYL